MQGLFYIGSQFYSVTGEGKTFSSSSSLQYNPDVSLTELVKKIVLKTKELSKSETTESPFAQKAKAAGYEYEGGKPDDITLALMRVKE